MNKKVAAFLSVGFLAMFSAFVLLGVGATSRAKSLNFAERFDTRSGAVKLTSKEAVGLYSADKGHSYIGFRVMHMGLAEVPGSFNDFKSTINFDPENINKSSVEFSAKVTSVDTRVAGRDKHLRSKDFFEVEKYPDLTFKSTKVEKNGNNLKVYGNLTLKGVTKEVVIPFKIHGPVKGRRGRMKMGIQGAANINRRDFNVNYATNAIVSDNVKIDLQLELAKRNP